MTAAPAIDEPRTVEDRYILATGSTDLSLRPGRCDADRLLAAAYAARKDRRGMWGLALWRLGYTSDRSCLKLMVSTATGWLIGRGQRAGGKDRLRSHAEAQRLATSAVLWYCYGNCKACEGRKYDRIPGTPHTSGNRCKTCEGSGKPPLESVEPLHVEHMRWLAAEFDGLQGYVMRDMARALGSSMELA